MKTLTTPILSMVMLLTMPVFVSAQVFNGNLTLSTQAEVDAFNYTEVTRDLIIGYADGSTLSDINNLQPLSTLTKVGSSLIIRNNNQLQDLQGLENLTTISELIIANNVSLTSLNILTNLTSLDVLYIHNIDQLEDLQGLDNLTNLYTLIVEDNASLSSLNHLGSMSSDCDLIIIHNNDQLEDLQGLENVSSASYIEINGNEQLQHIKALGNLSSANFLKIIANGQLQSLQGLEKITSIRDGLNIYDNDQLSDLQGLNNLAEIGFINNTNNAQRQELQRLTNSPEMSNQSEQGVAQLRYTRLTEDDVFYGLYIWDNDQLKNLKGLDNLTVIDGYDAVVMIASNASLTSLQGLENLTSINTESAAGGDVFIIDNPSLTSLQSLENLIDVDAYLYIKGNPVLVSLQGLNNLTRVSFHFYIENNDQLQDLKGLERFTTAEGIVIRNNNQLENLEGLDNLSKILEISIIDNPKLTSLGSLKKVTYIEQLTISNNNQLQDLKRLENLSSIYSLRIINNDLLKNLKGLEKLTQLSSIVIDENDQMEDLHGLENLTTISTRLQITDNPALVSLQGLENLQSLRRPSIERNPNLNDCCAIADLISKAEGPKDINNNGSNCNSVEAIEENCPPVITRFFLIDADTDQDILDLEETIVPQVINLSETGNQLNIRANTAGEVGSVVFALDGAMVRKENVAPYALFGDEPTGDYGAGMFALGRHTLTATPYTGKNGKGKPGIPLTLEFVVVDQALAVISFILVTTDDDQIQYELTEGSTISLQQFDHTKLNIVANTFPSFVGSVVFDLNKVKNFRTENAHPYALAGDEPTGDYKDHTFTPGTYHLTATPYAEPRGRGKAGNPLSITFEVVEEDQMALARTVATVAPKIKEVDGNVEDLSVAQEATNVWVYPNPSDEVLQVQVAGLRDSQSSINLILYSPLGKKVWEGTAGANHTTYIEVSHLSGGVYFLKAVGDGYSHMQRLLVK